MMQRTSNSTSAKECLHRDLAARLLDWYSKNARDLPWRRTRDPYAVWISEIMLQQTQVRTVISYFERWMRELPTVRDAASAPESRILKLWEGLGYYSRARNIQKAARIISSDHQGIFPSDYEQILSLPGIGKYTAGAISSIAFNQPRPLVDGNVIRVFSRLFLVRSPIQSRSAQERFWALAEALVQEAGRIEHATGEKECCSRFNQSLMELGALICTPQNPACDVCPVRTQCAALKHRLVQALPRSAKRPAITRKRVAAFVVEQKGRYLVRPRPGGTVNGGLWEFPNVELDSQPASLAAPFEIIGPALGKIVHSITRYRITMEIFPAKLGRGRKQLPRDSSQWCSLAEIQELPLSSAHRKLTQFLAAKPNPSAAPPQKSNC